MPLNNVRNFYAKLTCSIVFCWIGAVHAAEQSPEIIINGADQALANNIESLVSLSNISCAAQPARVNRLLPGIRQNVQRAGRALGYYLLSQTTQFERSESCWVLNINVVPNAPVTINSINIQIADNEQLFFNELENLPLNVGDQLNQAAYERIKTSLSARAIELGFLVSGVP